MDRLTGPLAEALRSGGAAVTVFVPVDAAYAEIYSPEKLGGHACADDLLHVRASVGGQRHWGTAACTHLLL